MTFGGMADGRFIVEILHLILSSFALDKTIMYGVLFAIKIIKAAPSVNASSSAGLIMPAIPCAGFCVNPQRVMTLHHQLAAARCATRRVDHVTNAVSVGVTPFCSPITTKSVEKRILWKLDRRTQNLAVWSTIAIARAHCKLSSATGHHPFRQCACITH
ncbi:hypothetical protein EDD21DRAFT_376442 [Dissophora ornata]|nr:hypothetical protein EDD21DRAFT_376442 [Dissophora ornata]